MSTALAAPAAVGVAAAAGCAAIWFADPTTPGGIIPVCPTKALFGIDCPGCGGCRMIYALLHGDVPAALHYNAVALVGVVLLMTAYVTWIVGRVRGRRLPGWQHLRYAPAVTLVVIAVWFVIRNIPVAPFTGLHV
nr:DUF2752 domain-containing protein [Williamsia sterculiae]